MNEPTPTVLNVDADATRLANKSEILRRWRFAVVEARSGSVALDLAVRIKPCLALIEASLPDMQGSDLCSRIKADPASAAVLVLQTSHTPMSSRERMHALEAGVDSCLMATFEPEELIASVKALLRLRPAEEAGTQLTAKLERERALAALREAEERFRELAATVNQVFWITDYSTRRLIYVSPAYERLWGMSAAALYQDKGSWLGAIHPEDRERTERAFLEQILHGKFDAEYRIITPDGRMCWVHDHGYPAKDSAGDVYRVYGIAEDITHHKAAEQALVASESRYRNLIELAPDAFFIVRENQILYANAACLRLFGAQKASELVGRNPLEMVHADYHAAVLESVRYVLFEGRSTPSVEEKFVRLDGSIIDVEVSAAPYADEAGQGVQVLARDIAKRKQAEDALRASEEQLRLITDTAPVFIMHSDTELRYRFVNKAYAERFGLMPEQVIGKRIPEVVGEEAYASVRHHVEATLAGSRVEYEVNIPYQTIGRRYIHVINVPNLDARGKVVGFTGVMNDITDRKRAENALFQREQEFKTLVENSPDMISRLNRELRYVYVNPAIEGLSSLKASEYLGKTKTEVGLPQSVVRPWEEAAHAAFETGREQQFDFTLAAENGTCYYSSRVIPEFDHEGNVQSVLGITYDVTRRKRAEAELQQLLMRELKAREDAEAATRAKDEFLAVVSHELRTPLNAISGWTHILKSAPRLDAQTLQRAVDGIKRNTDAQLSLVEDLLDTARIITGKLRLEIQPVSLLPVIQSALDSVRAAADAKISSL